MKTQEIVSKVKELRELQALIEEAQAEAETSKDAIKANMGGSDVLLAGEYKITWKAVESRRLDTAALRRLCRSLPRGLPKPRRYAVSALHKGGKHMDYDQVIMTLFRQLDDEQKEIFIATVRKAWEKDRAKMGEPKAPSNAAGLPQTEAAR